MAEIKKKLEILVDIDNPVEEIKECIIGISVFHGSQHLTILKEIELWIGKTIEGAESVKQKATESERLE